jgi:hypothetical protein
VNRPQGFGEVQAAVHEKQGIGTERTRVWVTVRSRSELPPPTLHLIPNDIEVIRIAAGSPLRRN